MATGRVPTTANSPLTAKGDLFGYSTTQARVPVGADGETIVADSSTSTGLRYNANYAAGKNKIINGDFAINQRSFTSGTTSGTYGFDRWQLSFVGSAGTKTYSAQTFTAGTAPVAGYESANFARIVTNSLTGTDPLVQLDQRIEDVRTFANQTITVSFWAKSASGTPNILPYVSQFFGAGGSPSSEVFAGPSTAKTINTSWQRYSFVISVPSISGKVIGTTPNSSFLSVKILVAGGSDYASPFNTVGVQNNTFDIWGVQVEAGSVATAFQTATGTIQGETSACQRYFVKYASAGSTPFTVASFFSTTQADGVIGLPVQMRTAPTLSSSGDLRVYDFNANFNVISALVISDPDKLTVGIRATTTGGTQYRPARIQAYGDATAFIAFSAEL